MSESTTLSGERVQKLIAQAGIASRRDAEDLIREGQVTINGKTAVLGDKATLGVDAIKVKGKLIHFAETKVYYMIYKPKNFIAMIAEDEEGRPTLRDLIHKTIKERVFTVGRMDFKGEGAIILTNDGEMSQKILKSNDIIRRYHVKVDRHPTQEDLAKIARGGRIEGRSMVPYHVRVVENYTRNALVEVSFEGMGAVDVKKFFENKGFFPEKVARVGIGHISAEKLAPGDYKKLNPSSVEALFLQPELAKKHIAGLAEKRTAGMKTVDEETMKTDAENKRRGKSSEFVTKSDRTFKPTGFVREHRPAGGAMRDERVTADRPARGDRPTRADRMARPSRPAFGSSDRTDRAPSARPARAFGDKPSRPSFGDKPRGDRPARAFGDKPTRSFGDKPARASYGDKPARSSFGSADRAPRGDRPARSFGDKPAGRSSFGSADRAPRGDRPARAFGDKPARSSFGSADRAPRGDRPARSFGDKPVRSSFASSDRPARGTSTARTTPAGGSIRFKRSER